MVPAALSEDELEELREAIINEHTNEFAQELLLERPEEQEGLAEPQLTLDECTDFG